MNSDFEAISQAQEEIWREYFSREGRTFFQRLLMFHRRTFISRAVRHWFNTEFPQTGTFVEAGAGTSESSGRIEHAGRKLIALDICKYVLDHHNVLPHKIHGDIFHLPFQDSSIDGIWNLGVMEHFNDDQIVQILKEFHRVLKPQAKVLLFWPPWYAPYEILLNSITWIADKFFGKRIVFFPDEINLYRTNSRARSFLKAAGFEMTRASFDYRDLFSYVVVVGQRS